MKKIKYGIFLMAVLFIFLSINTASADSNLVVTSINAPSSVGTEEEMNVTYTVQNQGDQAHSSYGICTTLFISTDNAWDESDPSICNYSWGPNGLAPGESYLKTETVTIPGLPEGNYYLLAGLGFYAATLEGVQYIGPGYISNYIPIYIKNPDLTVTNINAPSSVTTQEQSLTVDFTVTNQGNSIAAPSGTPSPPWVLWGWDGIRRVTDKLYFSTNTQLDETDILLGETTTPGPLNPGDNYTKTVPFTQPNVTTGTYYLLAVTNTNNGTYESNKSNNILTLPITVLNPDLIPISSDMPSTVVSQQTLDLSWTVQNQGNGNAYYGLNENPNGWFDGVYISTDNQWDTSDIELLRNINTTGPITPDSTYTKTVNITIPNLPTGNYYILIATDWLNNNGQHNGYVKLYENNENNNLLAVPITILPIIDVHTGESIQTAINNADAGGTIIVHGDNGSPATYTENLTVDKQLIIKIADGDAVTVQALNPNLPVFTITSSGSGSTIQGFDITGATNSNGINLESSDNCHINWNNVFGNCVGIKLYNSNNNNNIPGNYIHNNTWAGICLDHSTGNTINSSNTVTGNQEGIFLANNSNENTISENNIINNNGIGVSILSFSTGNTAISNSVSGNGVMGVFIQNSDANIISTNTVQYNGWTGICLDNANGNTINTNDVRCNGEGIFLANASTGNTIQANNIHNNNGTGISILGGSNNNIIQANTAISYNGVMGVFIQNSDNNQIVGDTVQGNYIQYNGWAGVCLDHACNNRISIVMVSLVYGNIISYNNEGVFLANNSNQNDISHNGGLDHGINNNTGCGISILNSNNNIIRGNNINSGGVTGIFIQNSNGTTVEIGNEIKNSGWAGIVLDTTTSTTIYQNNFENNPEQALAVNGTGNTFYQNTVGNYWSDWTTTNPRPIDGNENIYDQYPSTTPNRI